MLKVLISLILFFHTVAFSGYSQQIINYSTTQGLSQGSVFDIYRDKKGFMWFATADGLNRFDGYTFKVYRNKAGNPTLSKILESRDGYLWIGGWGGEIYRFNPYTEKSEPVFKSTNKNDIARAEPLFEDDDNGLWLTADTSGIFRIDCKTFKITDHISSASQYLFNPISTDNTKIWACSFTRGLISVDIKTKKTTYYFGPGKENKTGENFHITYLIREEEILWLGTDKGLIRFNPLTQLYKYYPVPSLKEGSWVRSLFIEGDHIWIGTTKSGIFIFDKKEEKISGYNNAGYPNSSDRIITKFFKDRSQNLWIGSDPYGVSKLNLKPQKFKYGTLNTKQNSGLNRNFIKTFFIDSHDKLYVGTHGAGLCITDRKTGKVEYFLNNKKGPGSIPGNIIYSVNEDKRGKLWIVTDFGITLLDPQTKAFSPIEAMPYKNEATGPATLKISSAGIILISKIFESPGIFEFFYLIPKPEGGYKKIIITELTKSVQCFYETNQSGILIASLNILYSLKINAAYPEKYSLTKVSESNAYIKSIYEDKKRVLWLATKTGLIEFNPVNNVSKIYEEKDGLPNSFLYSILPDEQNNLWISSNKGISAFNMSNKTFRNYDVSDGLQGNEFNTDAYYKSRSGEMFFGGTNGFNYFYPKDVKDNPFSSRPVITSFKVFDLEFKTDSAIEYKTSVNLHYDQNTISLEYAGLEFTDPDKNIYQYQLVGADKDPVRAGTKRFSRYTGLPPGHYIFRVWASNNDGVWGKDTAQIEINIFPPFWKTWWFNSLLIILSILFIAFGIKIYVNQKLIKEKRELRADQKIQEERNRISRDLHDNIGSEFVHILSQLDYASVIAAKNKETDIQIRIENISDNARDLMQMLKETIWAIEKDNLSFKEFIFKVKDLLIRYQSSFTAIHFSFHFDESYDNIKLKPLQLLNLFRIIQEGIANAIKHADATAIDIFLNHIEDHKLIIVIEDNGIGMVEKQFDDSHHGLRNMQSRIHEMGGTLTIEGIHNKGTKLQAEINLS